MKYLKYIFIFIFILLPLFFSGCSYDEDFDLCDVTVQLVYPDESDDYPYVGAPVLLKDNKGIIFKDSTNAAGIVSFSVPPGVYEASSSDNYRTYDYRYIFNGLKSNVVVSPDSVNLIQVNIKVTKKRIVH